MNEKRASGIAPYTGFDQLYVGGKWRDGATGATGPDEDPWSGAVIQNVAMAGPGDVDDALKSARDAQREWAATPPNVRAGVMRDAASIIASRREELIGWLVRESGSTATKAALEADYVPALLHEAASMPHHATGKILPSNVPGKENRVYRAPLGVVAVISPWNFPLALSSRSVAPALALGNTVVLKPSEDTPVTGGLFIAKALEEAGLPPGVLQVLTHSRDHAALIGDAIVESPIPPPAARRHPRQDPARQGRRGRPAPRRRALRPGRAVAAPARAPRHERHAHGPRGGLRPGHHDHPRR